MNNFINNSTKTKYIGSKQFKQTVFIVLMLAWPILHFAVFWGYINFNTIRLTFYQYNSGDGSYFFTGIANYKMIFRNFFFSGEKGGDIVQRTAIVNSLKSWPIGIFIILPLAIISSYAFYCKVRGEGFFRVVFYLPSIISVVVLTMSYRYMFNVNFGPIALTLKSFGFTGDLLDTSIKSSSIWPIIFLYCIWSGLGTNVLLLSSAMSRIPSEVTESAKLDGITFWRQLTSIVIPMVWPTITTLILLQTMGIFSFFSQPYFIGGADTIQTTTVAIYIYNIVKNNITSQMITATTVGVMFCVLGLPVIFGIKKLCESRSKDLEY